MQIKTVGLILLTSISLIGCSNKTEVINTETSIAVQETQRIEIKTAESTKNTEIEVESTENIESTENTEISESVDLYKVDDLYTYNQGVKQQYQNVKIQMDNYRYLGWTESTSYFEPLISGVLGKNGVMITYHNLYDRYPNLLNFNDITEDVIVTTVENTLEDGQVEIQEIQIPITFDLLIPDEIRNEINLQLSDSDLADCNMLWTDICGEKHLLVSKNINENKSYGICITQNNGLLKMVAVMDNGVNALKLQDAAYAIMKTAEFNGEKSLMSADNGTQLEGNQVKYVEFTQEINIEFGKTKYNDISDSFESYEYSDEIIDGKLRKVSLSKADILNPLVITLDGNDNILGIEADYHTERNLLYTNVYPKVFSPYMTLNEIVNQLGDKYTENEIDSEIEYTWNINDCIYKCTIYHKTNGSDAVSKCSIMKNVDKSHLPEIVEEIEIESGN